MASFKYNNSEKKQKKQANWEFEIITVLFIITNCTNAFLKYQQSKSYDRNLNIKCKII